MPLIDHIRACNAWAPAEFAPLTADGAQIGLVRRDRLDALVASGLCAAASDGLALNAAERDADALGDAFEAALTPLVEGEPGVPPARGEKLDVATDWGVAPVMRLERRLIPVIGARAYGVHANAWLGREGAIWLWTARRAKTDRTFPDQLDHLVAGGIASGYGPTETFVKEAWEEAGVPADLAGTAVSVGAVAYAVAAGGGLRNDTLFCYDIEIPADFAPRAVDGENAGFDLREARAVIDALRDGGGYKFNVPLVIIDFVIRRGLLTPENEPDYLALCAGLQSGVRPDGLPGGGASA